LTCEQPVSDVGESEFLKSQLAAQCTIRFTSELTFEKPVGDVGEIEIKAGLCEAPPILRVEIDKFLKSQFYSGFL